jgi:hypothetical protein
MGRKGEGHGKEKPPEKEESFGIYMKKVTLTLL